MVHGLLAYKQDMNFLLFYYYVLLRIFQLWPDASGWANVKGVRHLLVEDML